jgi:hypothetical protein
MTDAEAYGVDLGELFEESFTSKSHFELLREHLDRVRQYEVGRKFDELAEAARVRAEQERVNAQAIALAQRRLRTLPARKARAANREKPEPQFTDRQLEIAQKSLGLA